MTVFNACEYLVDRHVVGGHGERVAVRYLGEDTTYAQLRDDVARVAGGYRALGLRREERVLFFAADSLQLAEGILAAFRMGAVAVPVNTMLSAAELADIVRDSRARVVVTSADFAEAAGQAVSDAPDVTHLVVVGDSVPLAAGDVEVLTWDGLVSRVDEPVPVVGTLEDDSALWLYTSGTTGKPKGAMHRHANIRHVAETYGREVLGIQPEDRCLSVAKLFFAYGIGNSLFFPLSVGATTILEPRRPTPQVVAERVAADHPTVFYGVPTFFSAMLAANLPAEAMAGVRVATSAGEPLPAPLQQRWTGHFGVPILDGLGSTEALHIFISNQLDEIAPGTTGRPVPGYECQLRDEEGNLVPPGTPGSLFVKGESIATGYWCRTDTTRRVFQGQWLATGDTYVQDEAGRYVCLGRSNDMIKAGGIWVSPSEVEARLLQHDAVLEAAVVALPDADGLDKPVACVVLRTGATVVERNLIEFCREGMAHFKAPRSVRIVSELPRTATGKLQRYRVRELLTESRAWEAKPAEALAAPR